MQFKIYDFTIKVNNKKNVTTKLHHGFKTHENLAKYLDFFYCEVNDFKAGLF